MHQVYMISGPNSKHVYIGYCPKDDVSALDHFLVGTRRSEDRADVRFVEEHGGDANVLTATTISEHDTELEAFFKRNELRALTPYAFTGPTSWPTGVYERAKTTNPTRYEDAVAKWSARQQPTAREAYAKGLWTFKQIAELSKVVGREQIIVDLDRLTPNEFDVRYKING